LLGLASVLGASLADSERWRRMLPSKRALLTGMSRPHLYFEGKGWSTEPVDWATREKQEALRDMQWALQGRIKVQLHSEGELIDCPLRVEVKCFIPAGAPKYSYHCLVSLYHAHPEEILVMPDWVPDGFKTRYVLTLMGNLEQVYDHVSGRWPDDGPPVLDKVMLWSGDRQQVGIARVDSLVEIIGGLVERGIEASRKRVAWLQMIEDAYRAQHEAGAPRFTAVKLSDLQ
jgi:hypothetical protein